MMMPMATLCITMLALRNLAITSATPRKLSDPLIAGYDTNTDVQQHNRIDLDQKEMQSYLDQTPPDFVKAKAIYENGAHSGAYARMTVAALPAAIVKSQSVVQTGNSAATGYVKRDKGSGIEVIDVTYTSICIDNTASEDISTAGCYTTSGAISVGGSVAIGTPSAVQNKYRTLAGFSTNAGALMTGHATFEKFKSYYTHSDYGHRYVMNALNGDGGFASKDHAARVQGAKKGSAYMNVWMYTIREMEDAIADCKAGCLNCNDAPVHAWDEAVAFYTGSLEGTDGSGSGKLLYNLADIRCVNFKTCSGGTAVGTSEVNVRIFELFKRGQAKFLQGACSEVPAIRDAIIQYMSVPLIQGALRYAFKCSQASPSSKSKAEGAVFAAAILPLVHACSSTSALTISKNMKIDSVAPMAEGFAAVKSAFELTYPCLGVTCAQVGGYLMTNEEYHTGAAPCTAVQSSSHAPDSKGNSKLIVVAVISYIMFATR